MGGTTSNGSKNSNGSGDGDSRGRYNITDNMFDMFNENKNKETRVFQYLV